MKFRLLLYVLFISFTIFSQTFHNEYGTVEEETGDCIIKTNDGNLIFCGRIEESSISANSSIYVSKIEPNGALLWTKKYAGYDEDFPTGIIQTNDGGFAVVGSTFSFGIGSEEIFLIKTDQNGNLQWSKTYGTGSWDRGFSVIQSQNNDFYLGGNIFLNPIIIRTDSLGNLIWGKSFGTGLQRNIFSLVEDNDGIVFTGSQSGFGLGAFDFWAGKIDFSGNLTWLNAYGTAGEEHSRIIRKTDDGGYIIIGHTDNASFGAWDVLVLKIDSLGNEEWNTTFGDANDDFVGNIITFQNEYYTCFQTNSISNSSTRDLALVKLDAFGSVSWSKVFQNNFDEVLTFGAQNSIEILNNEIYYIGTNRDGSIGDYDATLRKLDINGNNCAATDVVFNENTLNITTTPILESTQDVGAESNAGFVESALLVQNNNLCSSLSTDSCYQITEQQFANNSLGGVLLESATGYYQVGAILDSIFILNFDANDQLIWKTSFKGVDEPFTRLNAKLKDNQFIYGCAHNAFSTSSNHQNIIFKFNVVTQSLEWTKKHIHNDQNRFWDLVIDDVNNAVIYTGNSKNNSIGTNQDLMWVKVDQNTGNLISQQHYELSNSETWMDVMKINNSIYLSGRLSFYSASTFRGSLTKVDLNGIDEFTMLYHEPATSNAWTYCYEINYDGNNIFLYGIGDRNNTSLVNANFMLVITDTLGNPIKEMDYEITPAVNRSFINGSTNVDDGFLVFGRYEENGSRNGLIFKTDFLGNLLWSNKVDFGPGNDEIFDAKQINNKIYITGQSANTQSFLIQINENGQALDNCTTIESIAMIQTEKLNPYNAAINLTPINYAISFTDENPILSNPNISELIICEENCISTVSDSCYLVQEYIFDSNSVGGEILKKQDGSFYTVNVKADSIFIVNYSSNYTVIWNHSFKAADVNLRWMNAVLDTNENIIGASYSLVNQGQPVTGLVFKFNPNTLSLDWIKHYYDNTTFTFHNIGLNTQTNAVMVVGSTYSNGVGTNADHLFLELDNTTGAIILEKHLDHIMDDTFFKPIYYNNSWFFNGRLSTSPIPGDYRVSLSNFDLLGNELFSKTYHATTNNLARMYSYGMEILNDEIYIFSHGDKSGTSTNNTVANFLKTDLNGNPLIEIDYDFQIGNSEFIFESSIANNGFLLFGRYIDGANQNAFVSKIDLNGNVLWAKYIDFGIGSLDWAFDAEEINGQIILSGGSENNTMFFIKFNPEVDTEVACFPLFDLPILASSVQNPVSENLTLTEINHSINLVDFNSTVSPNQTLNILNICEEFCEDALTFPIANFSIPDSVCVDDCINIVNQSSNAQMYNWSFEGALPAASMSENPMNICFPNQGEFSIQLIASDGNFSDTLVATINVFENPDVFENYVGCQGDGFSFTAPDGILFDENNPSGSGTVLGANGCLFQYFVNLSFDPTDCLGNCGGTFLPGSPCDDGNANTFNDTFDGNCNCFGIPAYCLTEGGNLQFTTAGFFGNNSYICHGANVFVDADDFVLQGQQTIHYVYHTLGPNLTSSDLPIPTANIIQLGNFINNGVNTAGQTIYVTAIGATTDTDGFPNFLDPCITLSNTLVMNMLNPIIIVSEENCDNDTGEFYYDFYVGGGLPEQIPGLQYTITGTFFNGPIDPLTPITIGPIIDGETYEIFAEDANFCGGELIRTIFCIKVAIELTEFDAVALNSHNKLSWTTASEYNNSHFVLEKSIDGINFESIAVVDSKFGTTSQTSEYAFNDYAIENGLVYYRLHDVDNDGNKKYHNIVLLERKAKDVLTFDIETVYPNPADKKINIIFNAREHSILQLKLIHSNGKTLVYKELSTSNSENQVVLNVERFESGIYYIQLSDNAQTVSKKVMIR